MSMDGSERSEMVGAHVRLVTKMALLIEAGRQETSISKLVDSWIEEKLKALGHDLTEKKLDDQERPLPLEAQ